MTTGLKTSVANSLLDALCRAVNYTAPVAFFVKLHTGDPGAAGASNAATNTTRTAATFSAASGGSSATSGDVAWTNVSTTETYSHVSFWDASSAGNFIGSTALSSSRSVVAGDDFTLPTGQLTLSLSPLAA
jgi:hypothetical protein